MLKLYASTQPLNYFTARIQSLLPIWLSWLKFTFMKAILDIWLNKCLSNHYLYSIRVRPQTLISGVI